MYTKNVDTPTSIVTSINEQVGDITISQESLGFDKELAEKADVGHTHDYAGSATAGGPATSAKKLNTDSGSSTKPVYFKNGMPVAIQYEIKASVPKNAQFTDTTYEATTGGAPGLIKLYDEIGNNTDGAMTQAAINNISSTMTDKSTVVNKTLLVSTWSGTSVPYRYELAVDGVTANSNQEIMPADGITDEQMYHLQGANLQDGGQDTNKNVLEAFGVKPSIDIPIKIIMRKD